MKEQTDCWKPFVFEKGDMAEKIVQTYEGISSQSGERFDFPTKSKIQSLVDRGTLSGLVYPVLCANELEKRGLSKWSDQILSQHYVIQMDSLQKSVNQHVSVYIARLLGKPATVYPEVTLERVVPFSHIETESRNHSFLSVNYEGICAITSLFGKVLYVNPQLFNGKLAEPLLSYEGSVFDREYVGRYYNFLKKTFGTENVDKTSPWLKKGKLLNE